MKRFLFDVAGYLLFFLATLLLVLGLLLPLFYLYTALIALVLIGLALLTLLLYPRPESAPLPGELLSRAPPDNNPAEKGLARRSWLDRPGTKKALSAIRLSLAAAILAFVVRGALALFTDYFYIESLSQDLEPVREAFRRETRREAARVPEDLELRNGEGAEAAAPEEDQP